MSSFALSHRKTGMWSILAVVAAVLTGLAVYSYLSWLRAQVPVAGKLVPLVVAKGDLAPGTVVGAEMLSTISHPQKYLPDQALDSYDRAIGKVVAVPIFEGEPITARKLGPSGGLSSIVPTGMRAYSLSIASGSSPDFLPKPGDRVDVIVTLPADVLGEATAVTALQHKEVASIGRGAAVSSGKVAEQLGLDGESRSLSITLYVTPEEAQRLAIAEALGKVTVVLAPSRPAQDPAPQPIKASSVHPG